MTMLRHGIEIDIRSTVEEVWSVLIDVEEWPRWTASMNEVRRLDTGPFVAGARIRVRQPKLPPATWTVTEVVPGVSFTWETRSPGVHTVAVHRLETGAEGGVRLHLGVTQVGALARLADRFAGELTRRYLEVESRGLKARVEGG